MEMSLGSGASSASDISYKIVDDYLIFDIEIKRINNRFNDIDFDFNSIDYVDILLNLVSSTMTGLKIDMIDVTTGDVMIFTAGKIMYSLEDWNAFVNYETINSLSGIQAKAKIDIQSVGFEVSPPDALQGIDQFLNLILSKSSSSNNIVIKKMTIGAELSDNKFIVDSKLDLTIGKADADIEILLPRTFGDISHILNFEIKFTNIDSAIASLIDASIVTVGLPFQKTPYGYLFKLVGTLDDLQPVLE